MLHVQMATRADKLEERGTQIEGEMVLKGRLQGKLDSLDIRGRDGLLLADKKRCCLAGKALCKFSLAANCLHKSQCFFCSILIMSLFHYSHCHSLFIFKSVEQPCIINVTPETSIFISIVTQILSCRCLIGPYWISFKFG